MDRRRNTGYICLEMTPASPVQSGSYDPATSPFFVEYEMTRWCELICNHCDVQRARIDKREDDLPTANVERMLAQISQFPQPPHLVLTGGDVLARDDVFRVVDHARELGVGTGIKLCPTPRLTPTAVGKLQHHGLGYLILGIDGPDAATHDRMRGGSISGDFTRTMRVLEWARQLRLPVQAETLLTLRNSRQLEAIAALLEARGVASWHVHFLGPHRRGLSEQRVAWTSYASLFDTLHGIDEHCDLRVEIVGANHHLPYGLRNGWRFDRGDENSAIPIRPDGLHAGKGLMFIDHAGLIYPAREVPIACGNLASDWLIEVYQRHPIFRGLRDPDRFRGKCGVCEYRQVCGGNRARAFAETGNELGDDPDCDYLPGRAVEAEAAG